MPALNPFMEAVMRKVLAEGPDAADRFVTEQLGEQKEVARRELARIEAEERAARQLIALARPMGTEGEDTGTVAVRTSAPSLNTQPDDGKRSIIINVAEEIAQSNPVVTTEAVVGRLLERGHILAGKRPGTSVGNILNRHPGWERVSEGRFRKAEASASAT